MTFNPSDLFEKHLLTLNIPHEPASLYEPIHYTLALGGKRIRPQLTLLACGLFGENPEKALPAASAVELLHNFTLIHDDIMDNADTRRGKPTVFKKWGMSEAILSGDVLFNISYRMLFPYHKTMSSDRFDALLREFDRAVTVVCEGQAHDLNLAKEITVQPEAYIDMIYAKTASLLEASLKMGALIGGATVEQANEIGLVGKWTGIAFQIQDDLLDALPSSEKFGKVRGGDVREGKKTLLWIRLMERVPQPERAVWNLLLEQAKMDETAVAKILEAFESRHVFTDVRAESEVYYQKGSALLNHLPQNEFSAYLSLLFEKLVHRDS